MRKKRSGRAGPAGSVGPAPGGETCWSRGKIPPCQRAMAQTQAVSNHRTDRRRPGFESRTSQTCFFWEEDRRDPLNPTLFCVAFRGAASQAREPWPGFFYFFCFRGRGPGAGAAGGAARAGDGQGAGGGQSGARAAGGAGAGRGARGGGRARLAPRGASACIQGGSDTGPRARRGAGRPRLRRRGRAGRSRGGTGSPPPRTAKCTGARRCCRRAARTNS